MRTFVNSFKRGSLASCVALIYLFLYLPIIVLVAFAFNEGAATLEWQGLTFKWFTYLFASSEIFDALCNSLIVSCTATALSLVFGLLVVLSMGYKYDRLVRFFYAPVLIPEVILAASLLSFFSQLQIPLGILTLVIGHTILGLGFVVPILHARYLELDKRLVEASLDLGATRLQTYKWIVLPLMKSSIIAAGLLAFTVSFDDFLVSFYCTGAASQTLSLYIFSTIKTGVNPLINALSVILLGAAIVLLSSFAALQTQRVDDE